MNNLNLFKNINEYELEYVGGVKQEDAESKLFIPSTSAISDLSFIFANLNDQTNQY